MLVSKIKCQEKLKKSVDKWMHLQYNTTCSERIGTLKTPKWRNWQTHLTQNQAGSRSCRFESGLRHQEIPRFFERGTAFLCKLACPLLELTQFAFKLLHLTIPQAYAIIYCVPGVQLSLVEHLIWDQDVAGSSPVTPTKLYCGCSLVVKPQPSKLMLWVRFPSPAPISYGPVAQLDRATAF